MTRPSRLPPYDGESYYDQPAVKAAHWDWTVGAYIAVAGLSGAAQALATLAHGRDPGRFEKTRRNARFLATAGAAIGAGLLIKDLKTPKRFYNMLRIFRSTSPMSIGTYILLKFGAFSAIGALGEVFPRFRRVADFAQFGAAGAGAGAATYTAALVSATSTPFWAATPRSLGAKFGASSVALGAASLSIGEQIGGRPENARPFDDIAAIASLAGLAASFAAKSGRHATGAGRTMHHLHETRALDRADLLLAACLPLGAYALNHFSGRRSSALSLAASAAVIAGGFLVRHRIVQAGHASTRPPEAYLRFAQPDNLPARVPPDRRRAALALGEGR